MDKCITVHPMQTMEWYCKFQARGFKALTILNCAYHHLLCVIGVLTHSLQDEHSNNGLPSTSFLRWEDTLVPTPMALFPIPAPQVI